MSTQVGMNAGLNTGVNTSLYQNNTTVPAVNSVMPNTLPTNIFGNNNLLQPSVNNYEDDFLMPEYLKMSNINANPYGALNQYQAQNQPAAQAQQQIPAQQEQQALINQPQALVNPQQTAFTAQPQMPVDNSQLMNGSLQEVDKNIGITEAGNPYQKSKTFAKYGTIAGVMTPVVTRGLSVLKGNKSFASAFKFKPLAVTAGILGALDWAAGKIADNFITGKRAQAADSQMLMAGQNQQYMVA